ncbi:CAP domain-containing protein [Paractinoplanes durhamensis]|uniref:CAP domain-containing protein n=1 Tax=Paractinoplanes durhamensis TaxID=113563 RepID=UPI00363DB1C9
MDFVGDTGDTLTFDDSTATGDGSDVGDSDGVRGNSDAADDDAEPDRDTSGDRRGVLAAQQRPAQPKLIQQRPAAQKQVQDLAGGLLATAREDVTRADVSSNPNARMQQQVLALVNQNRRRGGCDSLSVDRRLIEAANEHAADMARRDYFAHESPNGDGSGDRMREAGYQWKRYGENIARNVHSPYEVVDGWMHSPAHRENIMDCRLNQMGVGLAIDRDHTTYWVQDFATPRIRFCTLSPTCHFSTASGANRKHLTDSRHGRSPYTEASPAVLRCANTCPGEDQVASETGFRPPHRGRFGDPGRRRPRRHGIDAHGRRRHGPHRPGRQGRDHHRGHEGGGRELCHR